LHALSTKDLPHLEANWPAFVDKRSRNCQRRYQEKGLDEYWLQQIPRYLRYISLPYPFNYTPKLLISDVHQFHLLVTENEGTWRLCGFFDFDDARIGFHEYDLSSAGLFMMSGRPQLLRAFLHSYGYSEIELDETLTTRLMIYTLLHGYPYLNWIQEEAAANSSCSTLEAVANAIYDLAVLQQ
jgi:hygromycin-B 7''-O-kinase